MFRADSEVVLGNTTYVNLEMQRRIGEQRQEDQKYIYKKLEIYIYNKNICVNIDFNFTNLITSIKFQIQDT